MKRPDAETSRNRRNFLKAAGGAAVALAATTHSFGRAVVPVWRGSAVESVCRGNDFYGIQAESCSRATRQEGELVRSRSAPVSQFMAPLASPVSTTSTRTRYSDGCS